MPRTHLTVVALTCLFGSATTYGQWVEFNNETSSRLVSNPAVGANDTEEKDYIWGDVDHDGDIDLISVRKTPFTFSGGKANVLFMNEGIADGQAHRRDRRCARWQRRCARFPTFDRPVGHAVWPTLRCRHNRTDGKRARWNY